MIKLLDFLRCCLCDLSLKHIHARLASLLALLNIIFNISNIAHVPYEHKWETRPWYCIQYHVGRCFVKLPLYVAKSLCDPIYGCAWLLETNRINVSLILNCLTLSLPSFLELYRVYGKFFRTSRSKNSSSCFTNTGLITNYLKVCFFSFQALASHYCMGKRPHIS